MTAPTPSKYPTIERLADLTRTTVGYQKPDLEREAVECRRDLAAAQEAIRQCKVLYIETIARAVRAEADLAAAKAELAAMKEQLELAGYERSSAVEAFNVLSAYLGWKEGGLGAAAIETVQRAEAAERERDALRQLYNAKIPIHERRRLPSPIWNETDDPLTASFWPECTCVECYALHHMAYWKRKAEEAERDLRKYGRHLDSCGDHDDYNHEAIKKCGCGFDAAIAAKGGA